MPGPRNTKKIVLFDAVGTVIHTTPGVVSVYHQFGQQFGSSLTQSEVASRFQVARRALFAVGTTANHQQQGELVSSDEIEHNLWRGFIKMVFHDLPRTDELFQRLWDFFSVADNWQTYSDVGQCFESLKSMGCVLAIASNFDSRLFSVLENRKEFEQVHGIFCSAKLGYRKPDPAFYQHLRSQLAEELAEPISPDQIVFVGDCIENDFHGPRRQDWTAYWLNRSDDRQSSSIASGKWGDYELTTLESLPEQIAHRHGNNQK